MAMKKKTSKKTTLKSATTRVKKKVDDVLVRISPGLQQKVDRLIGTLDNSRQGLAGDLSFLASQILVRAQEISRGLRQMKPSRKVKKRGSKK